MLRIAKQLPAGEMPKPSKKLVLQWYYMTYHCAACAEYVKSRKKQPTEMIESLTDYFQVLFAQKKVNGTLEHAEMDWLCNFAKQHVTNYVHKKCNACMTGYVRRKLW
jgi:hypothetical protein